MVTAAGNSHCGNPTGLGASWRALRGLALGPPRRAMLRPRGPRLGVGDLAKHHVVPPLVRPAPPDPRFRSRRPATSRPRPAPVRPPPAWRAKMTSRWQFPGIFQN